MRLVNRIAACAVAAVLSVSMLTACGGGGEAPAASSSSSGSAASSSANSSASSETNSASSSASSSSSASTASSAASSSASSETSSGAVEIKYQNSLMYAWSKAISGKYYAEGEFKQSTQYGGVETNYFKYAVNGKKTYWCIQDKSDTMKLISDDNSNVSYMIYDSAKIAFRLEGISNSSSGSNPSNPAIMYDSSIIYPKCTREYVNKGGKTYTLEKMSYTADGKSYCAACYFLNNELKEIVAYIDGVEEYRCTLKVFNTNPSDSLFEVPSGYAVYTEKTGEDGYTHFYDDAGNDVTMEVIEKLSH